MRMPQAESSEWNAHAAGNPGAEAARRRQNTIDHIILTVSDFERSVAFYAKALKPLGITSFTDYEGQDGHPNLRGFGDGKELFSGSKKEASILKRCMLDLERKTMLRWMHSTKRPWTP